MSLIKPDKLTLPFAASGNKNVIPVASQIGITGGAASYTDGFPPLTITPLSAGGEPPFGKDMNGVIYSISDVVCWLNAGGGFEYDSVFANDTNINGYSAGAKVKRTDGLGYWLNTIAGNKVDPETSGADAAGWVPDFTNGISRIVMSNSSVTLTPLQYGKPIIVLTGTITADLNLIFPAIASGWTVINNTSGLYNITCKTSSGIGVAVALSANPIICDGTDIQFIKVSVVSTIADICQTVESGPADANNIPTFLPATSVSLNLTTQNISVGYNSLKITAANGFNANGSPNDVFISLTANITFTGCTASQTNYLPVSADAGTAQTPMTLAPIYQEAGTPSITSGQYTYIKNRRQMYLGNGTVASAVNHVIVGEAVAGASTITSTVAYAYKGKYKSTFLSLPSNGTVTNFNHNIGYIGPEMKYKAVVKCLTSEQGITVGEIFDFMGITGSSNYPFNPVSTTSRNASILVKSNAGSYQWVNYRRSATIGEIFTPTESYYNYAVIVDRGW